MDCYNGSQFPAPHTRYNSYLHGARLRGACSGRRVLITYPGTLARATGGLPTSSSPHMDMDHAVWTTPRGCHSTRGLCWWTTLRLDGYVVNPAFTSL